jgi:iron complex transport system permease protein
MERVNPLRSRAEEGMGAEHQRLIRRRVLILSALPVVLFITALVGTFVGSSGPIGPGIEVAPGVVERISFGDAVDAILHGHGDWPFDYHAIFWTQRIPRVLLAVLVGASLACAGTAMQAVFRNPMADPFIVGVSSGASVGAVAATLAGLSTAAVVGTFLTPLLAFCSALLTVFAVYRLGTIRGKVYVDTLLLSGVAMAAFLGAVVSAMIYFAREYFDRIIFWLLGSLSMQSWTADAILAVTVGAGVLVIFIYSRDLNALLLGEETAHNLGSDPESLKTIMLIVAAVMTAAAVAFTGVIGFIGLIIPHTMRIIVGADHRVLVPASTLAGAIFLVCADAIARTVISPNTLPVGVVTAMCGGPFFLYLLRRNRIQGEKL